MDLWALGLMQSRCRRSRGVASENWSSDEFLKKAGSGDWLMEGALVPRRGSKLPKIHLLDQPELQALGVSVSTSIDWIAHTRSSHSTVPDHAHSLASERAERALVLMPFLFFRLWQLDWSSTRGAC